MCPIHFINWITPGGTLHRLYLRVFPFSIFLYIYCVSIYLYLRAHFSQPFPNNNNIENLIYTHTRSNSLHQSLIIFFFFILHLGVGPIDGEFTGPDIRSKYPPVPITQQDFLFFLTFAQQQRVDKVSDISGRDRSNGISVVYKEKKNGRANIVVQYESSSSPSPSTDV